MRKKVQEMTEEEFKVYREAVQVKLAEKDISHSKQHARHWAEIATHNYLFDRQSKELDLLESVTLQDFVDHFESTFFSASSKRLDFHLNAELHKEEQKEYRSINEKHEATEKLRRYGFDGSLAEFKKEQGLHPDTYKANYAKFLEGK